MSNAHHDMLGEAGPEAGSLLSPPACGDTHDTRTGDARPASQKGLDSEREDPTDPFHPRDTLENVRMEALTSAQAAVASGRARDEPSRDGSNTGGGESVAGKPGKKHINTGWWYGRNGKGAPAIEREDKGRRIGVAEGDAREDEVDACGGIARGPVTGERKRAGALVDEAEGLVDMRRGAHRFQEEAGIRDREDLNGMTFGNPLHEGLRKPRSPGHRTGMMVNTDAAQASAVSHDGRTGSGDDIDPARAEYTVIGVQHARARFSPVTSRSTDTTRTTECVAGQKRKAPSGRLSEDERSPGEKRGSGDDYNAAKKREEVLEREFAGDDTCLSRGRTSDSESCEVDEDGSRGGESEDSGSGKEGARKRRARRHGEGTTENTRGDRRDRLHGNPIRKNDIGAEGGSIDRDGEECTAGGKGERDSGDNFIGGRGATSDNQDSPIGRDKGQEGTTACGYAHEIARPGRTFDVIGTPKQTWDHALDTIIAELSAVGHATLQRNLKKKTMDKSRYNYCEILCKHSGHPRKKAPTPADTKPRRSASKKVGCPFKIVITWPLRESNPSISSSSCQHNHNPRGLTSGEAAPTLPPSIVDERIDDLRRWTASELSAKEIIELLETGHDGLSLCKMGKRKVYNVMRKVKDELQSILEDASDVRSAVGSESGMDCGHNEHDIVADVSWAAPGDARDCAERLGGSVERQVFASMMAKSKDYVEDVMRSLPPREALAVQDKVGEYVQLLLKASGAHAAPQHSVPGAPDGA
ncbi:unnamed protein product [Scytosiphon promiscuus]